MASKTDIILRGPEDWIEWDSEFKSQAIAMQIWDCIKENPKDLLTEPKKPDPKAYKTAEASTSSLKTASTTESSIIDLTPDELRNFQIAWNIYTADLKAYDNQTKEVRELKDWVRSSIAQQYKSSSCDPTETLHQWYTKLKEHASFGVAREMQQVRQKYKDAVEPLDKPPRNWNSWILAWEEAMALGELQKLSETKDAAVWFDDFIQAIKLVAGPWALSYKMVHEAEIGKGTLTYRKVANDLREMTRPRALGGSGSGYPRSSNPSSQSMRDASANQQTPGRTGKKREWNTTSEGDEYCLACERIGHQLEDCFYVFPTKAFEGFRPRKSIQRRVDQNREKEEVIAELGRLKKLRREE